MEANNEKLHQTGIRVRLTGEDGNAFFILARVRAALKKGGYSQEFIDAFTKEATSSDYNHLLVTCMEVCVVE